MSKKIPVYMMPGLASSPKIFEYIKLPEQYDIYWMEWIIPQKNEELSSYVTRLIEQINHKNPIIIGVSFGGIIAQEISKQINVQKIVLISTIKTHKEFPSFLINSYKYKIYKLFPSRLASKIEFLEKIAFTKSIKLKAKLYKTYLDVNDPKYMKWAVKNVLTWRQDDYPTTDFIHIVGEKDRVFPIKNIQEPFIKVKNGYHDMIIVRAGWFNEHLPKYLV